MHSRLQNLPVSFFSTVMGLSGMAIALQRAGDLWVSSPVLGNFVALVSLLVFVVLLLFYGVKVVRYPEQVIGELSDPVKMSFGATITVSMVLLSITTLQLAPTLSKALWITGASLHLVYTLYALNTWIHKTDFEITHISPAWFIPVVGNILVPVAGVIYASPEISWFFFSIGMLFWIILLAIIFNRVMFHNPMQEKLMPTLFILIAPPAVGFIAYMNLTGELDAFARVLYFAGLFLTLLMLAQIKRFARLQFFLSWWAYSFPLAAITIASLHMYELTQKLPYQYIGGALLTLLTVVVAFLLYRTAGAIKNHKICVEEH